ncbi:hypothetical protein KIMH_12730 [Bombiscardovia apis]|uniref:Lipoprotein n=2 Tax=Bombiscardovia apis TaxID=2932182 RepID=A0ABM8BE32_9BIFI|nr:hypothetical protein KIMH_12730 [Bombiscardovia apis]
MQQARRKLMSRSLVTCCALLLCLSACGGEVGSSDKAQESGSPSDDNFQGVFQSTGEKMATSIAVLARKRIDETDPSDFQKQILEKAVSQGSISTGDYENAWASFKRCFTEKGHGDISFEKTSNGIYDQTYDVPSDSPAEADKIQKDFQLCSSEYSSEISYIYELQVGNPNLYSNPREAALDCLHKSGAVPKNYSLQQLNKDISSGPDATIDVFSSPVQNCFVPNNIFLYDLSKK